MSIAISMVTFSELPQLSAEKIAGFVKEHWTDAEPVSELKDDAMSACFRIGAADVIIGLMPAPIPWSDLEEPCATSLLWPNAAPALREHKAHASVTVSGSSVPIALATLLTKATAAVMGTCVNSSGVFWTNSMSLIRKDIFIDFATQVMPKGAPLFIWIGTRIGKNADQTTTGYTTGMRALGHMEFEALSASEAASGLRDRFHSLANYVLDNGPVIRDGDTVGQDQNEHIRVVFADSSFGQKERVMRLVYK